MCRSYPSLRGSLGSARAVGAGAAPICASDHHVIPCIGCSRCRHKRSSPAMAPDGSRSAKWKKLSEAMGCAKPSRDFEIAARRALSRTRSRADLHLSLARCLGDDAFYCE